MILLGLSNIIQSQNLSFYGSSNSKNPRVKIASWILMNYSIIQSGKYLYEGTELAHSPLSAVGYLVF